MPTGSSLGGFMRFENTDKIVKALEERLEGTLTRFPEKKLRDLIFF